MEHLSRKLESLQLSRNHAEKRLNRLFEPKTYACVGLTSKNVDSLENDGVTKLVRPILPFDVVLHIAQNSSNKSVLASFESLSKEHFRAAQIGHLDTSWLVECDKLAFPGALRRLNILSKQVSPKRLCQLLVEENTWKSMCNTHFGENETGTLAGEHRQTSYKRLFDALKIDSDIDRLRTRINLCAQVLPLPCYVRDGEIIPLTKPAFIAKIGTLVAANVLTLNAPFAAAYVTFVVSDFRIDALKEARRKILAE